MRVGIDASNIRLGGGVTHLRELLAAAEPTIHGIQRVIIWGGTETLAQLPDLPWLEKVHEKVLDGGLISRLAWQRYKLPRLARDMCDLLFIPGGNYHGGFRPFVAMSQNLLPFMRSEWRRYVIGFQRLRLFLLRYGQGITFLRANGVIFLTPNARSRVEAEIGKLTSRVSIIPHGIGSAFIQIPRQQLPLAAYSMEQPFRWLYVSMMDFYKHQSIVVEAIAMLRSEGMPVELDLIGPADPQYLKQFNKKLRRIDPNGVFIHYLGPIPYEQLASNYQKADGFIFASSCENLPIILMEAMAAGMPVVCSNCNPMPEILGDSGIYFDPESPIGIAVALREMLSDTNKRQEYADRAYQRALEFTWERCAKETFQFLALVATCQSNNRVIPVGEVLLR